MSHSHASRATPSRRKWFIDLQIRKHERLMINTTNELHLSSSSSANLIPIGFSEQRVSDQITQEDDERLLAKRSWDIALQPIKQLPMNVILAWMAGNSFSLMSIMIVLMLFMKPIQVCFLSRLVSSHRSSFVLRQFFLLDRHSLHWNKKVSLETFGFIK